MKQTFYDFLAKSNPELNQLLINMGIREKITKEAELYACDRVIEELKDLFSEPKKEETK